jgi:hypothetical protein
MNPDDALNRKARKALLKTSIFSRLLKKVQMQGGAGCEARGVLIRTSQRRASAGGTHPEDGSQQMGLFEQPAGLRRYFLTG